MEITETEGEWAEVALVAMTGPKRQLATTKESCFATDPMSLASRGSPSEEDSSPLILG